MEATLFNRRNPTRWTYIVLVISIIFVLSNPGSCGVTRENNKADEQSTICKTEACHNAALKIRKNMDPKISPCDNFYRFACGGLLNSTVIPDKNIGVSVIAGVWHKIKEQVKTMLEEPILPNEINALKVPKKFYKSCSNQTQVEKHGLEPLRKIFKQVGGWPVLERMKWNETAFNWIQQTYKLRDLGLSIDCFFTIAVTNPPKNNTQRLLFLDEASLGLSRSDFLGGRNTEALEEYYKYMVDIAEIFGAEREFAKKDLNDSLEFEKQLANISITYEERENCSSFYVPTNISELIVKYPSIPWREYFRRFFPQDTQVYDNDIIMIADTNYFSDLEKLMKNVPKRSQANFLMWTITSSMIQYLNKRVRDRRLEYLSSTGVFITGDSLEVKCAEKVSEFFPLNVGALYVRKYLNKNIKDNTSEMVKSIQNQFGQIINNATWMDNNTKNSAHEKLMSMKNYIAYPDEFFNDSKLENLYKGLVLYEDNYLQSGLSLLSFDMDNKLRELRKPVNKNNWEIHGDLLYGSGRYYVKANSIDIPAGTLQNEFFNIDHPQYMNFGGIGFIIGHEITHGFDNEGKKFDGKGKLVDWWDPSTNDKFLEKTKCLVDQYNNYKVEEVNATVNGSITLTENIADNAGIKAAYYAYLDWSKKNKKEQSLPDLDWTPNQMFWISAANSWCTLMKPNVLARFLQFFPSSPEEFRIVGSFSNLPEFSKDFNCPLRSKMNPEKKCNICKSTWWTHTALMIGIILTRPSPGFCGVIQKNFITNKQSSVCETPACHDAASEISKSIDLNISPCDNFYRFACGGFLNSTVIPNDEMNVNIFSELNDKIHEKLRGIFEEPISPNEIKPFRLMKTYYKTCLNETAIEKYGLEPVLKIFKQLGGWPVVEGNKWNENNFNWIDIIYKLCDMNFNVNSFFSINVGVDSRNNTKRILYLGEASIGLPREYLLEDVNKNILGAYFNYMVDIAEIFGAHSEFAKKDLNASLDFQRQLAKISLSREQFQNVSLLYNPMTISELSVNYPSVPWKEYFVRFLPSSVSVYDNDTVIVVSPSYFSNLEKLMKTIPKRTQANYLMWTITTSLIPFLNKKVRSRRIEFLKVFTGKIEQKSRQKYCVNEAADIFAISVGALYIRKYFSKDAKKNAVEMVTDIHNEFKQSLRKNTWMSQTTKNKTLEKAMLMSKYIAYPDELFDDSKLEDCVKDLEFSNDNYLHNLLKLTSFSMNYKNSLLRKPVNNSDWKTHGSSAVVNAFYSSAENSIQFPAGILQGKFFSYDRPKYMNYGAIGFVIGHEITHGFDNQGRQFNSEGNLFNWWDTSTNDQFLQKTKCLIDQYNNYEVEGVNATVNGVNTLGENIADNGGIKMAYHAYLNWSKRNGKEQKLPNLDWTPNQLFWISAANNWCSISRPELLQSRIYNSNHSPEEFRVVGPLSNMPEFSDDFKCSIGSKMNPVKKCNVW